MRQHRLGTSLVARSTDAAKLDAACRRIKDLLLRFTAGSKLEERGLGITKAPG